jgi:hypothetical protein
MNVRMQPGNLPADPPVAYAGKWTLPLVQEQEKKLRDEYLGLGGSASSSIPNYFLYIIIGISFLAVGTASAS